MVGHGLQIARDATTVGLGEQQHGALVLFETLPEVMSIGFRDPASFAILLCRDGWQLPFAMR